MLEEETDRFEDHRDLASRVNQVHLLRQPFAPVGQANWGQDDT